MVVVVIAVAALAAFVVVVVIVVVVLRSWRYDLNDSNGTVGDDNSDYKQTTVRHLHCSSIPYNPWPCQPEGSLTLPATPHSVPLWSSLNSPICRKVMYVIAGW